MQRTFKYFTIAAGGTPQPLIGTTTTAVITPSLASVFPTPSPVGLPIADSSMFTKGDVIFVDVGANQEVAVVFSVPTSTLLQVTGLFKAHSSGVYVGLNIPVNSLYVQTKDGNAAAIYIGTSNSMVKATGVGVIAKLQNVSSGSQPVEFVGSLVGLGANPYSVGQIWVDGNTGDSYLPSFGLV